MDAARLIEMAPPEPEKTQANKHRRSGSRPAKAGILNPVAQAAAMAAAIAVFLVVAAASTTLLLALVAAARASRRHRGSRYCVPSSASLHPSSLPSTPRCAVLDLCRLPTFAFPDGEEEGGGGGGGGDDGSSFSSATCAVCLEAARSGERWRAMPACRHAFHAACVDRWLARKPACPLCRTAVTASAS
ncbi:unnamed protein product [Urochloa decumbens]|uniref:RING-type domain-containing protein n=1 Tax=Urochloa decumbens TaxID=240449 RepID=A0ABC9ANP0_9POAL